MDTCINIEALHQGITKLLNESGLTVGAGLFVVKDIYNSLYLLYLDEIEKEKEKEKNFTKENTIIAEVPGNQECEEEIEEESQNDETND